jgi:hypothetical protein
MYLPRCVLFIAIDVDNVTMHGWTNLIHTLRICRTLFTVHAGDLPITPSTAPAWIWPEKSNLSDWMANICKIMQIWSIQCDPVANILQDPSFAIEFGIWSINFGAFAQKFWATKVILRDRSKLQRHPATASSLSHVVSWDSRNDGAFLVVTSN